MDIFKNRFFEQLKGFDSYAFASGVRIKTEIDQQTFLKGIGEISKFFKYLTESDYDKDKKIFKLKNNEPELDKQIQIHIIGLNFFHFLWGINANINIEKEISQVFDKFQELFNITSINISFLDFRFYATSDFNANHYALINKVFFGDSKLGALFQKNKILENTITISGLIDESRICAIKIESDVDNEEIKNNKFNNNVLQTTIGIGQTKNFNIEQSLGELFLFNSQKALNFITNTYLENVLKPLDEIIVETKNKIKK